ncbi:unnamed protein product [Linum trigynum]|uniref:Uncharacterized protein n=1 Tax=Linum trigynum TaxID=586398 RepID=A0AAV2D443_9ROSI
MIGKHRRHHRRHHGNLRFESNTWNLEESGLNLEDFRPLRFSPSSSPSSSARLPSAIQNPPIVSYRPHPFIVASSSTHAKRFKGPPTRIPIQN